MSARNDGGAAFPTSFNKDYPTEMVGGMSLRDYFAAQALAALVGGRSWDHLSDCKPETLMVTWATAAYSLADAMLKAREA